MLHTSPRKVKLNPRSSPYGYERPPGAQALQDALGLLEARAQFDSAEREVHVRVADHGGAIYVDLANDRWEAVEITTDGWQVVESEATPVRFRGSWIWTSESSYSTHLGE